MINKILAEIKSLEFKTDHPLEWWDSNRVDQIEAIVVRVEALFKELPANVPQDHLKKLHEFLRMLQHVYKMHDKNFEKNVRQVSKQYNIADVKRMDVMVDAVCQEIQQNMKEKPMVSVVVSMWNGNPDILEMTEKMFFDGMAKFGLPHMEIIVVDDASPLSQETDEMMARVKPIIEKAGHSLIYTRSHINLGYTHSYNVGLRKASGNYIFLTNSDVRISLGVMRRMLELLTKKNIKNDEESKKLGRIGIVGPMLTNVANYIPQLATKDLEIESYDDQEIAKVDNFAVGFNRVNRSADPVQVKFIFGSFMAIAREVVKEVGFFNEKFKNGYVEETDYCYAAAKKGFSVVVARDVFAFHGGINKSRVSKQFNYSSQSTGVKGSHWRNQIRATTNEIPFIRNHGFKAFFEKVKHIQKPDTHSHLEKPIMPE